MNENLGASFSIDISDLQNGINKANRLIRESESEFRAAAAGMDDWQNSEEGLTAKLKQLNSTAEIQAEKVKALQNEYDRLIDEGMDPSSKKAVELRTKLNNETAALKKTEKAIEEQTEALNSLEKQSDETGDATDDMSSKFDKLKSLGKGVAAGVAGIAGACVGAVGAFLALGEATKETQTAIAKLEQSFDTASFSAETAHETLNSLYGVLGDMDRSVEASNLLAKMSKSEEDLAENSRILTGVFAEFGDSIPTEGLAEGMQATAKMGSVQGVLADALEWQGINLDNYNEKLATMTTEEERAAYIQSTLVDLYGASADAYRENNKALIESNEAQLRLDKTLAEIGAVALPIMTSLKNIAADVLETLKPFIELMGEGLSGALKGSADSSEKLAEGLGGILSSIVELVTDMLPTLLSVIVKVIPTIITSLLDRVPMLVRLVFDIINQIIEALTQMAPELLTMVVKVIMWVIDAVVDAIPELLTAAIKLFTAIVDALPQIVDALLANLMELIVTVIWGLMDAMPQLLDAAIKLFTAIVDAIPEIVELLIEYLPWIIDTIIEGLMEALPLLLDAAVKLFMAIIDAIPTIVKLLVVQMPKIVKTITSTLIKNIPNVLTAAVKLFGGVVSGIAKIIPNLVKQIPKIVSTVVKGLTSGISSVRDVGQNLIRGLWNGISDMSSWIGNKIRSFSSNVLGGIKDFFGIHSPSRVMADVVGKNLALGIGEGFEDNISGVNDQITSAMNFENETGPKSGAKGAVGGVTVYQTNHYSQAHSRVELYKTKQNTEAAVRLAVSQKAV